ncbi:hypothetical protein BHE90_010744 [Fusarium euwallaceae]|uniref:Zn(2)-C6 fungal-type domain-containing protein n=1 Tax=Fusarium euwallaceae TaxID=1147111 RepID=A0A430LGJ9_9HYPO|nr:hypothetical protein BHE90_010744 [Fusarium euwallaceae]
MAGVPSSKGCKACVRQKKKCDQVKPVCARCARLKIACIGAGEQKWKFKPVSFQPIAFQPAVVEEIPKKPRRSIKVTIPPVPENIITSIAGRFIAALEVSDIRYSLSSYGDFLEHIPRRLGRSEALDASVKALVSAFPYHYTRHLPQDALANYIDALKALRICLNCPDKRLAPETLSAIYIIMICQGWIGRSDDYVRSHGEILAHLASSAIVQNWKDTFELQLLETLFVPLILEAMVNPAITMESWFLLVDYCIPQASFQKTHGLRIPSVEAQKLIRMPVFFHSPMLYIDEIKSAYQEMQQDLPGIRQYLANLDQNESTRGNRAKLSHKFRVVHALLLTLAIPLNSLLRTLYPNDEVLFQEAISLTNEFIILAQHASQHRPLGATYIPPCLAGVWAITDSLHVQQAELQRLMEEYQPDSPLINWMEQAVWLKASHKTLLDQVAGRASSEGSWDGHLSMVHCMAGFGPSGSCLFT